MKLLYIGSSGALSLVPFEKLLSSGYTITAVGVSKPLNFSGKIIALENESLALAARSHGIPLLDLSRPLDDVLEECQNLSVDIILMSCYNKRLPDEIIKIAKNGCFNLHPSLLPRYRGPEPIFWQMKAASTLGVSWHKVIHEFDAGDVLIERRVIADDGASYTEINKQLAECGAELMMELLMGLSEDKSMSNPQNPDVASYYPYPQKKDFTIDTEWTALHAYNFMCATRIFGFPYQCQIENYKYSLIQALDFDNNAILDEAEIQADRLYIPCAEGVLVATYTDRITF